ncbi:hypothetical protein OVA26_16725 [Microbacterium sp. SL62]|uniref:hypothetical protein n=1 Tax=Microbacterium sp. SL62 TaxID=2995139 RepID=UPI00227275CA|nr:hypothetical protein [Microbacterium sp. SL62]MCY1718583.1 hypothetical protein [Microbacterium sp. SL62]
MRDQIPHGPDFFDGGAQQASNVIVVTEPGLGTLAMLRREMDAKGFTHVTIPASRLEREFLDKVACDQSVDTLVIDDADDLLVGSDVHKVIEGVFNTRFSIPHLKRIVLVYLQLPGRRVDDSRVALRGGVSTTVIVRQEARGGAKDGVIEIHKSIRTAEPQTASLVGARSNTAPKRSLVIMPALFNAEPRISVEFSIEGEKPTSGTCVITKSGNRVWVETFVDGEVILSNKLDPNVPENDFDVLRAELAHLQEEFRMPLSNGSIDGAATIVHTYVSGGRASSW